MSKPLRGQRVLITGAAQGLGAGIARYFSRHGAALTLMDVDGGALGTVASSLGASAITVDLADAVQVRQAALRALEAGVFDTLIHNAAILRPEPLSAVSLDTFSATMNVGIQAGFLLAQALWPGMEKNGGGVMIFVSSQSGIKGFAEETAYCAAKHALEGFSKCLALEAGDSGIVSCTITPGKAMHTPMSERTYPPELRTEWIDPEDLAPAFRVIAETRNPEFNGARLDAWRLCNEEANR